MIVTVPVHVVGDCWHDIDKFQQCLQSITQEQTVMLDLKAEGPSLHSLGIVDCVQQWADHNQRHVTDILVTAWSNGVESVPYQRVDCNTISHFFGFSKNYWCDIQNPVPADYFFGVFFGRRTLARARIMYDICRELNTDDFLLSQMSTKNQMQFIKTPTNSRNLEQWEHWVKPKEQGNFESWLKNNLITSLDKHDVADQYRTAHSMFDCATSLLAHYHRFNIEIVAETYTMGRCFLPTEKTVRPIMAGKPWLVYGPRGFIKELQQLGFHSFSTLWDESYDDLEGPVRWQAIKTVIQRLSNLRGIEKKHLLQQANAIAYKNRKVLHNLIKKL